VLSRSTSSRNTKRAIKITQELKDYILKKLPEEVKNEADKSGS